MDKEYLIIEGSVLIKIADAHNHLKNFDLALDYAKKFLAICEDNKNILGNAYVYQVIASIYHNMGNTSESEKYSKLSKNA